MLKNCALEKTPTRNFERFLRSMTTSILPFSLLTTYKTLNWEIISGSSEIIDFVEFPLKI